jgi:hypothetical protein
VCAQGSRWGFADTTIQHLGFVYRMEIRTV